MENFIKMWIFLLLAISLIAVLGLILTAIPLLVTIVATAVASFFITKESK